MSDLETAAHQALDALEQLANIEHPLHKVTRRSSETGHIVTVYPHKIAAEAATALRAALFQSTTTWTQAHWTEYERSIAAAESEACAVLAEEQSCSCCWGEEAQEMATHIAAAIRARGQS
jgi:hypothetical protein